MQRLAPLLVAGVVHAALRRPWGNVLGQTLVFGVEGEPTVLDGARSTAARRLASGRRSILESLLSVGANGDLKPSLACRGSRAATGGVDVRAPDGVKFHDGTSLDAAAVCANFDRWDQVTGILLCLSTSSGPVIRPVLGTVATPDLAPHGRRLLGGA